MISWNKYFSNVPWQVIRKVKFLWRNVYFLKDYILKKICVKYLFECLRMKIFSKYVAWEKKHIGSK